MQSLRSFSGNWRRPIWVLLLVAASMAFSFGLACATPFAALCAVAACTLPRRDALCVAGVAWLANQAIGFGFLNYPWTANCLAGGVAIGLAALLCAAAVLGLRRWLIRLPFLMGNVVALAVAFAVYEVVLFASAVVLGGGLEAFAPSIVGMILGINAVAWVGLSALSWLGSWSGIAAFSPTAWPIAG